LAEKKNPAILCGIFGILRGVTKFLCIYSMISRGTPDEVVRNFGWETVTWDIQCELSGRQ